MKRLLLSLAVTTALCSHAVALEAPKASTDDSNMRTVPYQAQNRTIIVGTVGRATMLTFGQDETIWRVVFGKPEDPGWKGPDPKSGSFRNNLPLWPIKPGINNLLVITHLADGSERPYQFKLIAKADGGDDDPDATYGLTFTYPQQVKQAAVAAAAVRRAKAQEAVAKNRLATDAFYGPRNWQFVAHGLRANSWIAPDEISDNGQETAFRYKGNRQIPAVYAVDASGQERLTPFTMKDDLMIVQQTSPSFRLRLGDAVLDVINRGYDPIGQNPRTGTTSPDVVRELKTAGDIDR